MQSLAPDPRGGQTRPMNRTPLLRPLAHVAAALALMLTSASPAAANSKRYGLVSFERIEIEGNMIVEVVPGRSIFAVADASREALETLSIEVNESRTLIVTQLAEGVFGPRRANNDAGPIRIRISAQNLSQLALRGGGRVTLTGLRGPEMRVDLNGSGSIAASGVNGDVLLVRSEGSGTISLAGRAQSMTATIAGATSVDAAALETRNLVVRANGSGASRFAALQSADLLSGGAADLAVSGRPRCTVRNIGAGTITCGTSARANLPTTDDRN